MITSGLSQVHLSGTTFASSHQYSGYLHVSNSTTNRIGIGSLAFMQPVVNSLGVLYVSGPRDADIFDIFHYLFLVDLDLEINYEVNSTFDEVEDLIRRARTLRIKELSDIEYARKQRNKKILAYTFLAINVISTVLNIIIYFL